MDEYLRDFVQESEENIRELNAALLDLENDPDDEEAMDEVFRTAHTLKGNCGAMGFTDAEALAHAIEDRLDDVRAGRLEVTPELMDEVFAAVDELETMVDEVRDHGEPRTDPAETVRTLRSMGPEETLEPPTEKELDEAVRAADDPTDPEQNVFHVRLDVGTGDEVNNAALVVEALEDAFDLLGTDPPRDEIIAGEASGEFDAVFGSAVGEASIEGALEPIDRVHGAVITDVTGRVETTSETDADFRGGVSDSGKMTDISTGEADDMEVDELLDEFDAYDDLDEMVERVEDTDDLGDLGQAGTFDDVDVDLGIDVPEPTADVEEDVGEMDIESDDVGASERTTADASAEADPDDVEAGAGDVAADESEEVDDASEAFQELQEEVDPVGFDELQNELEDLEFDQYDQEEEVGFDELLSEEELEDDSFEAMSEEEVDQAVDDMLVDEETGGGTAGFTTGGSGEEAAADTSTPETTETGDASSPEGAGGPADTEATADSTAGIGDFALDDEDVEFDETVEDRDVEADDDGTGEFADDLFGGETEADAAASEVEPDVSPAEEPEPTLEPLDESEPAKGPTVAPADETESAIEPLEQPEPSVSPADETKSAVEPIEEPEPAVTPGTDPVPAIEPATDSGAAAGADDDSAVRPVTRADAEPAVEPASPEVGSADGAPTEAAEGPSQPDGPATPGEAPDSAEAAGESFEASPTDDLETEVDFGTDQDVEFDTADEESLELDTADEGDAFEAETDEPGSATEESGFGSFDDDVGDEFSADVEADLEAESDFAPDEDIGFDDEAEAGGFGEDPVSEITFGDEESSEAVDADATTDAETSADAAEEVDRTTPDEETGDVEVEEFSADEAADVDVDETIGGDLGDTEDIASELEGTEMSPDVGTEPADDLSLGERFGESGDRGIGGIDTDRGEVDAEPSPSESAAPDREQLPDREVDLDELLPTPPHEAAEEREEGDEIQSVRVDIDQVDRLLNLVEGMVTTRARLRRAVESGESLADIDQEIDTLEDLTNDLQEAVMDVRLVPLEKTASRIPRTVRDIAREQDKQVDFRMEGEDVEIDRSVLDDIGDPLTHLVRNAVDHGIEPPEEREEAGKDPEGTVELRAERRRDDVVIEVEDDGRGLHPDELLDAAVEEGILDEDEAADLTEEEAYELAFHPGFSTASEVTDVSGRGVGMDVVKSTVDDLDGDVDIESEPGEGTTVRMILPVTVAIDDVLFVEAGGEEFGVPLKAVEEIGRLPEVEVLDDGDAVRFGDREQSLLDLADELDVADDDRDGGGMLLHLREDVREAALRCDAVRTQQEVVVRPFEDLLGEIPGLGGAAILGEGEVVTILDVDSL